MTRIITNLKSTFCVFNTKNKKSCYYIHAFRSFIKNAKPNGPNGQIVFAGPMIYCLSPTEKKNKVIFIQNDQNPSLCLRPYSEH